MRKFKLRPDLPDIRDYKYHALRMANPIDAYPNGVDLRPEIYKIKNQGNLGACTAFALTELHEHVLNVKKSPLELSPLFLYYNERVVENDINEDRGACLRDGCKSVVTQGNALERLWPYATSEFTIPPPILAYNDAKNRTLSKYVRLETVDDCMHCLISGQTFVAGITCYKSFLSNEVKETGNIPLPPINSLDSVVGGHAIHIVGYDCTQKRWIFQNSWSTEWGDKGFGYLPWEYLINSDLCSDMWSVIP